MGFWNPADDVVAEMPGQPPAQFGAGDQVVAEAKPEPIKFGADDREVSNDELWRSLRVSQLTAQYRQDLENKGYLQVAPQVQAGIGSAGASAASLLARIIPGAGDFAEDLALQSEAIMQAAAEKDNDWWSRAQRTSANSIAQLAPIAAAAAAAPATAGTSLAPYAALGFGAAIEGNRAITTGRMEGLRGADLARFAATEAVIEGAVGTAFQLAGVGGVESMIKAGWGKQLKQLVSEGVKPALKAIGKTYAEEVPEEVLTEWAHLIANKAVKSGKFDSPAEGVNRVTPEEVYQTAFDTTIATFLTVGVMGAPRIGAAAATDLKTRSWDGAKSQSPEQIEAAAQKLFASKKASINNVSIAAEMHRNDPEWTVSRREWSAMDLDNERRNAKDRTAIVRRIGELNREAFERNQPAVQQTVEEQYGDLISESGMQIGTEATGQAQPGGNTEPVINTFESPRSIGPVPGTEGKAPVSQRKFANAMRKMFGIAIRSRKLPAGWAGVYDNFKQAIALMKGKENDIDAGAHEVAHHIDALTAEQWREKTGDIFPQPDPTLPADAQRMAQDQRYGWHALWGRPTFIARSKQADPLSQLPETDQRWGESIDAELHALDYYLGHNEAQRQMLYGMIGQAPPGPTSQSEGFAEWVRLFLTFGERPITGQRHNMDKVHKRANQVQGLPQNPTLQQLAPRIWQLMHDQFAKENPKLWQSLLKAQKLARQYQDQGTLARGRAQFQPINEPVVNPYDVTANTVSELRHKLITTHFDMAYRIRLIEQKVLHQKPSQYDPFKGTADPWQLFWIGGNTDHEMTEIAKQEGMFLLDYNNIIKPTLPADTTTFTFSRSGLSGARLEDISSLVSAEEYATEWAAWLKANHLRQVIRKEMQRKHISEDEFWSKHNFYGMERQDYEFLLGSVTGDKQTRYEQAAQIVNDVCNDCLRLMVMWGAMTQEEYNRMTAYYEGKYVPMQRAGENDPTFIAPTGTFHTESFVRGRSLTRSKKLTPGTNIETGHPLDLVHQQMRATFRLMHQRNLIVSLGLSTSKEFAQFLRDHGYSVTPGSEPPQGLGWAMEVIQGHKQYKHTAQKIASIIRPLLKAKVIDRERYFLLNAVMRLAGRPVQKLLQSRVVNGKRQIVSAQFRRALAAAFGVNMTAKQWKNLSRQDKKMWIDRLQEYFDTQLPKYNALLEQYMPTIEEEIGDRIVPFKWGKDYIFVQYDPLLYDIIKTTPNNTGRSTLETVARKIGRILKLGAVLLSPTFAVRNIFYDLPATILQGSAGHNLKEIRQNVSPALKTIFQTIGMNMRRNLKRIGRDDIVRWWDGGRPPKRNELMSMMRSGGLSMSGIKGSQNIEETMHHEKPWGQLNFAWKTGRLATTTGRAVEDLLSGSDLVWRTLEAVAIARDAGYELKEGTRGLQFTPIPGRNVPDKPPEQLVLQIIHGASTLTTNFRMHGAATADMNKWWHGFDAQSLDSWLAFYNAAAQGLRAAFNRIMTAIGTRGTERDQHIARVRFAIWAGYSVMVEAAYLMLAGNDDDWKERPAWHWNKYYGFSLGKWGMIEIPKGRLHAVLSNSIEAAYREATEKDRRAFLEFVGFTLENNDPTGVVQMRGDRLRVGLPRINGLRPVMDAYANYDSFTDRQIENEGDQRLPVVMRGADSATPLGRTLSRLGLHTLGMSPAKIDYFLNATTGGLEKMIPGNTPKYRGMSGQLLAYTGMRALWNPRPLQRSNTEFSEEYRIREMRMLGHMKVGDAAWTEEYGDVAVMRQYRDLRSKMRVHQFAIDDKAMKDKIDNWIGFLSREALGRDPMPGEDNFWKADLPHELSKMRSDFRTYMREKSQDRPMKRRSSDDSFAITRGKAASARKAAAKWLSTH